MVLQYWWPECLLLRRGRQHSGKQIWNCLMHYLCNNQGSKFILQIIIAFVASMAKISQSSEPLTGCAFSGKLQHWVSNAECTARVLAARRPWHYRVGLLPLHNANQSINQSFEWNDWISLRNTYKFLNLTSDTYRQNISHPPISLSAYIK